MRTGVLAMALSGCVAAGPEVAPAAATRDARYLGVQTRLLQDDLVSFIVEMRGADGPEDVSGYARCAAAQYALIRGYGFARHVRTNIDEASGVWRADAVYVVSPSLPQGSSTLDAEVVVGGCRADGIPTV